MSSSYQRQNRMHFRTLLKSKADGLQSIFIFLLSICESSFFRFVNKTIDCRRLLLFCGSFVQSFLVSVGNVTDRVEFHRGSVIFSWRAKFASYYGTKLRPRLKTIPPYIWGFGKENPPHAYIFLENRRAKFGLFFII